MSETEKKPRKRTPRGGTKTYTCANPNCGVEFTAFQSDRTHPATYHSQGCFLSHQAARRREKRVEKPCGHCGEMVNKPVSRDTGKQLFCNREHYLLWRHSSYRDK